MSNSILPRKAPLGPGKHFNGQLGAAAELHLSRQIMANFIKGNPFLRYMRKQQLRAEKRRVKNSPTP